MRILVGDGTVTDPQYKIRPYNVQPYCNLQYSKSTTAYSLLPVVMVRITAPTWSRTAAAKEAGSNLNMTSLRLATVDSEPLVSWRYATPLLRYGTTIKHREIRRGHEKYKYGRERARELECLSSPRPSESSVLTISIISLATNVLPHETERPVDNANLRKLGILHWAISLDRDAPPGGGWESDIDRIVEQEGYRNRDMMNVTKEGFGDQFETKLKMFFKE